MPSLIQIAKSIPGMTTTHTKSTNTSEVQMALKELKGEGHDSLVVTTTEVVQKLDALKLIHTFLQTLKGNLAKYLEEIT